MTTERETRMIELRKQGETYDEIAKQFGITKQRVQQVLAPYKIRRPAKRHDEKRYVFPNIVRWMNINDMSFAKFGATVGKAGAVVHRYITGKISPNFNFVVKVLEVTGMTFEEAFERRE